MQQQRVLALTGRKKEGERRKLGHIVQEIEGERRREREREKEREVPTELEVRLLIYLATLGVISADRGGDFVDRSLAPPAGQGINSFFSLRTITRHKLIWDGADFRASEGRRLAS